MCGTDLLEVDPRDLSGSALGEHVARLEVLVRRAQAAQAAAVRVFEVRDEADAAGSPSAKAWLCAHLGLAEPEARRLVALGRALDRLPVLAAAFAEGATTAAHVRIAAAAARSLSDETVRAGDAALAPSARVLDARRFAEVVRRWVARVAPAEFERDTERRYDSRWFAVSETFGGMHSVAGMLDPESGALLADAIAGLVAANPSDDARNPGQQRADALADLTRAAVGAGTGAPVRPEIVVHVAAEALVDSRRLRESGAAAEVDGAGPIPAATFDRLACDATWRRLLLDAMDVPVALGRSTRAVPAGLRKLVALRDGGCRYPGCVRGPTYCDAHHAVFWRDGGRTEAGNLVLLCHYHHHLVHERRHALRLLTDATVVVTRPDGRVLTGSLRGAVVGGLPGSRSRPEHRALGGPRHRSMAVRR